MVKKQSRNSNLSKAKNAKNDEFYTQLTDIEKELKYYSKHFRGKTVYCNCDDPFKSNFFKYFVLNFNQLGLKKLIATHYVSTAVGGGKKSHKAMVTKVEGDTDDTEFDIVELFRSGDNELTALEGNGDFRSEESIELLKEADIVVTNPPFSLFREYIAQLIDYQKQFLIIGNANSMFCEEIFPLFKGNDMWVGHSPRNLKFVLPNGSLKSVNTWWYTNLDFSKHREELTLTNKYSSEKYPKYDNYDAINVDKVIEIPIDYDGVMGVPVTFIDKYNPEQFEILGLTNGQHIPEIGPLKRYINATQVNADGSTTSGGKTNTSAMIPLDEVPSDRVYYTAENSDGPMRMAYTRILMRNRHPEKPEGEN